ncbi:MAG: peptidyl-tRNA hydrolase Pth2 [Halobacteriaceae archaeon]
MKQAIVVRSDLDMGVGKLAAQVAHASLKAYENADKNQQNKWKSEGQKKVVLKAKNEQQLFELAESANTKGVPNAIISDAGYTQLEQGTVTTLGVGPDDDDNIDAITGELSLY